MENLLDIIGIQNVLLIVAIFNVILLIAFVIAIVKITNISKKYKNFMQKLGNGKHIEEDLENYMYRVERVEKQNGEMVNLVKNLDHDLKRCIQKVGIIRYNAFNDTGSDLSFALALLDENNDGVVLNGIYSREMSNIYAKPVEDGKSSYTISEEEKEAIRKAIQSKDIARYR